MNEQPLAERMRPATLDDIVGHSRWIGPDTPLGGALRSGRTRSLVLWGPPGCGKTTLARAMAATVSMRFVQLSAVLDGVKALRELIDEPKGGLGLKQQAPLLFIDEIHRWSRTQQDALLPHVESGALVLIGATTENPSAQLTPALRSRLQVVRLEPLSDDDVLGLLQRALIDPRGLAEQPLDLDDEVLPAIAASAAGDARRALTDLEQIAENAPPGKRITRELCAKILARADLRHSRSGDDHFDVVSALIKSMRGSDPDAAIYWLARMLEGGEDAAYIARRLVIFASEDVGNADPRALQVAVDAADAVRHIGLPEGRIPLAQAVIWLATCPKSNASYLAIDAAIADVRARGALPVPLHLRDANTDTARAQGFGAEYRYPHDFPHHIVKQQYLPDALVGRRYYKPTPQGVEKTIAERMAWWANKLDAPERR